MITIKRRGQVVALATPDQLTPKARSLWDARCGEPGREPKSWTMELGAAVSLWDVLRMESLHKATGGELR